MVDRYWVPQKLPQIYTVIAEYLYLGRLRDLQYIFAAIYETLSSIVLA